MRNGGTGARERARHRRMALRRGLPGPGKRLCRLGNTRYNVARTRVLHSLGAALRPASLRTGD